MKEQIKAILLIPVALFVAFAEGWDDFQRWRHGDGGEWEEIK